MEAGRSLGPASLVSQEALGSVRISVSKSKVESDAGRHLWPPHAYTKTRLLATQLDDCYSQP